MNQLPTLPTDPSGLSCAILRKAAIVLLLVSAPAFLFTLQMRRNDLRKAEYARMHDQNISTLEGMAARASAAGNDCLRLQQAGRKTNVGVMYEARLDPVGRSRGLAVLLSPARELASVNERVPVMLSPCGGV